MPYCKECGSSNLSKAGYAKDKYGNKVKGKHIYQCKDCGRLSTLNETEIEKTGVMVLSF